VEILTTFGLLPVTSTTLGTLGIGLISFLEAGCFPSGSYVRSKGDETTEKKTGGCEFRPASERDALYLYSRIGAYDLAGLNHSAGSQGSVSSR